MGDMADFYLSSQSPDYSDDLSTDWYEYGGVLSCRYCKKDDLCWGIDESTGKYRLFSIQTGLKHNCSKYKKVR